MKRIYPKEEVCIGCHLCEVYCAVQHSSSRDIIKAFKREQPPVPRVRVEEKDAVSFAILCRHCEEPLCICACPSGALWKDEQGVVRLDEEKCVACWGCIMVCPYGAIFPDFSRNKAVKCDLCPGQEVPACVAHCPNRALVLTVDGK